MEKLPTIILPEGKRPVESAFPGCSSEDPADGSSAARGSRASSAGSNGSRGSSGGLQSQVHEGMPYVCRSSSSRSASLHLLTAPVPAAGSLARTPPAEAVPSLLRLTSVRLRACKPPLLAEDFYIRRIGMQLLHPPVPPEIRWLGRSNSSLLSRRSPAHSSLASSRRSSTCKRASHHNVSSPRVDASSSNSPGGSSANTQPTHSSSSTSGRSSSGTAGSSSSITGVTGGNDTSSSKGKSMLRSSTSSEQLSSSITSGCSFVWGQNSGRGDKDHEGSEHSLGWTTVAERRQQVGEEVEATAREGGKGEENSNRMQTRDTAEGRDSPAACLTAPGRKREEIEGAAAEEVEERQKWEAVARGIAGEYAVPSAVSEGAAASQVSEWPEKAGLEASDISEHLRRAGSFRSEEERERSWLLENRRNSPYCVGCHGTGDAACAKPAAAPASAPPASRASPEAMECVYKQGGHELVLEIVPPALQPGAAGITPKAYQHLHEDVFSRLAFSVSDVNAAQVALSSHMIRTGAAAQFADVNFAVTCLDMENFRLRLLQRLSEYSFVRRDGMQQQRHRRTLSRLGSEECPPLGSTPFFHHVELRVRDPAASLAFYQRALQFRLISKQAVPSFRLTLYFLTTDSTALPPQQAELDSHANRSWLWEQSFSSICLKVYDDAERRATLRPYEELQPHEAGFLGFTLTCKQMNERALLASLEAASVPYSKDEDPFYGAAVYHLRDPDGIPLRILICDDACGV